MQTIYRLKDRPESVHRMQEASLSHPFLGVKITHRLIGSQEWWDNITSGHLPLHPVRGIARGLWLGMHNSEPGSFAMELADGTWFKSMTTLDAAESARMFTLGRFVEVDYVEQEAKHAPPGTPKHFQVVLEIRLDSHSAPSVEPVVPCYFTFPGNQPP